jgi:DNA polymerase III delta prime subunit
MTKKDTITEVPVAHVQTETNPVSFEVRHKLWCEQYRPRTLDDYVFHDAKQRVAFERFCSDKTIPHLLLSGVQGSGKTTIAQILISAMELEESDVMTINASDENSVDVMRDKIKGFISTFAMGDFKIVHLEEADYLSLNAQGVLRPFMETFADQARFILTCNYENKIIPPIKSRCQHHRFKAGDKNDITMYAAKILQAEGIKVNLDLLDRYIAVGYPDIRKIVNMLQQNSADGILTDLTTDSEAGDYKFELLGLIEVDNWQGARAVVCANVATEEWEDVYRFLYENLDKSIKFKNLETWQSGIVIVAEHLYKHSLSADPEINAASMFIQLGML